MTTPNEVLALAQGMGRGTRFERARAGATTLSAFLQLDTGAKRELAVAVAQRAAPELVPRIQAESGLDFTQEQSRAVLDMVGRLDGDDLAEVAASLASPEARSQTAAAVAAAAATATGLDDVVPASPATGDPAAAPSRPTAAPVSSEPDVQLLQRVAALEAKLGETETEALRAMEAHEQATGALDEARAQVSALEQRLLDADAERAALQRAHAGEVEELERRVRDAHRTTRRDVAERSSRTTIGGDGMLTFESPAAALAAHSPDGTPALRTPATVAVSVSELAAGIDGMSAGAALRRVRGQVDRLGDQSTGQLAAILQVIPDGWARRRALTTMVEAGVAGPEDVGLLGMLERPGEQVFAASAFLDAGVSFAEVAEHLDPRAAGRLQRRRV